VVLSIVSGDGLKLGILLISGIFTNPEDGSVPAVLSTA
jgi:hypothetical protein